MYAIHLYAQFGCFAFDDSIHVSAQPVTPSFGITEETGTLSALSVLTWYGHDAPMVEPPFLNRSIWSDASAQYFLTSGRWDLSSVTVASSCAFVSSYGSLIPSDGLVFERYSAASAI